MNSKNLRIAAMVNFSYSILSVCCSQLKNSGMYHGKAKNLVNQLSNFLHPLLSSTKREKLILNRIKISNEEELDNLSEDEKMVYDFVKNSMEVLIVGGPNKVFEVNMAIENIMNNKRLFTQEEYDLK